MEEVTGYAPASLSFIFRICPNKDLAKMGSVGVGCTIDDEVTVEVGKASFAEVIFNGTPINFPTVYSVIKTLIKDPVKVSIKSSLPLGYGFGISSASSLGCAYAINRLFQLGKTELELAEIAHICEIRNFTGLGSVATQITGGFLVKNKPGIPTDVVKLPFVGKSLYAVIIDRLETPTVLRNKKQLEIINKSAKSALGQIRNIKGITLAEIIDISYLCAKKSGLIINEEENIIIDQIKKRGGCATVSMLGCVVISTIKLDNIKEYPVKELVISDKTVKYL